MNTLFSLYNVDYLVKALDHKWVGNRHPFIFPDGELTRYGFDADLGNGWYNPTL